MARPMKLKSYGKINLGLRVLGKRPDGYHEIETILQTVDLCDEIIFRPLTGGIRLVCTHPLVPEDDRNLAWKSVEMIREKCGITEGIQITIKKSIPVGAGLGGGSSNAAVTLRGLAEMWGLPLTEQDLFCLAGEIGSDVPFFLKGGTALATGRGQRLEYLDSDWGDRSFVVIYPKIEVSSAWAYKSLKLDLTQTRKYVNLKVLFNTWTFGHSSRMDLLLNDLEEGVNRRYPVVGLAKEALLSAGALAAAMTGSGSAVYGIFGSWGEARKAAQRLQQPRWDVFLTRPIKLWRGGGGRGDH